MSDLKVRPPKVPGQPGISCPTIEADRLKAVLLLFEPFVEVDAFGIFPGGAGEEVQMTGEDLGIDVEQPFGFAGRRLRSAGGTLSRRGGG